VTDERDQHTNRERPHAADEIAQHVDDEIANALNTGTARRRDITEAIVQDVDHEINDTDEALDRGPDIGRQ
jgi:hypothetical protein